jgi:hypothetical protein
LDFKGVWKFMAKITKNLWEKIPRITFFCFFHKKNFFWEECLMASISVYGGIGNDNLAGGTGAIHCWVLPATTFWTAAAAMTP